MDRDSHQKALAANATGSSLSSVHLAPPSYPPAHYETDSDEGFDEDWADEFPLYSKSSGVQYLPYKPSNPINTSSSSLPTDSLDLSTLQAFPVISLVEAPGLGASPSASSASSPSEAMTSVAFSKAQERQGVPFSSNDSVSSNSPTQTLPPFVPPWISSFTRPIADNAVANTEIDSSLSTASLETKHPPTHKTLTSSTPQNAEKQSVSTSSNLASQAGTYNAKASGGRSLESLGEAVRQIAKATDFTHLEPGSQRNKDSVLHYFVATHESEEILDQYLTGIIQAFLETPTSINANTSEDPSVIRSRFGQFKVPRSGDYGTALEEYLFTVKANVIDKATRVSSPRMIGHMTSALPYFHRPLARLLTALNQNVVKLETAMTMTYLERETIAMLHREFFRRSNTFYDHHMHAFDRSLGVFTSGGTIANITAMWTARNKALKADHEAAVAAAKKDGKRAKAFRGVDKEGLFKALMQFGYKGAVIIGSALMHYSFKKAADLLGIGDEGLCLIPTDKEFRMRTDLLEAKVKEFKANKFLIIAIVGIAGTTETGSIDNLSRINSIAKEHKIHFHVDAAWGGPLIFSREHQSKLHGIAEADTITIDGHKQLYTPMGLGLVLFRNPTDASHIRKSASYVIRHDSPDLGKFTLEGSRPATSLHLHASLHLLGRDGVESLVTRSATLVRQMAARLRTHPKGCFQTLHEPSTNILLYRYIPARLRYKVAAMAPLEPEEDEEISDATRRIQNRQAREGVAGFVSRTSVGLPDPSFGDILVRPFSVLHSRASTSSTSTSPDRTTAPNTRRRSPATTPVLQAAALRMATCEDDEEDEEILGAPPLRRVDAFRVVIANPLTKWEDVEAVIAEQLLIGETVEAEMAIEKPRGVTEKVSMWIGWPFDM
ncbi:hypothetical protein HDU67_000178 [Dinochytrium kinnereticum]|nr:hypothetical protein HDU67_000178 [Dinochytrium kinnereticum]